MSTRSRRGEKENATAIASPAPVTSPPKGDGGGQKKRDHSASSSNSTPTAADGPPESKHSKRSDAALDRPVGLESPDVDDGTSKSGNTKRCLMLTARGVNKPGIAHALLSATIQTSCRILDLHQIVVHDKVVLVILIELAGDLQVLKDLLYESREMGVKLEFRVVKDVHEVERIKAVAGTFKKIILTVVAPELTASFLMDLSKALADRDVRIKEVNPLTDREETVGAMELHLEVPAQGFTQDLKSSVLEISASHSVDAVMQYDSLIRSRRRIVFFDLSKLVSQHAS